MMMDLKYQGEIQFEVPKKHIENKHAGSYESYILKTKIITCIQASPGKK
jgi:hypothetical protein